MAKYKITWKNDSVNHTGQEIWRKLDDGEWVKVADLGPEVREYTDLTAPDDGSLSYRVDVTGSASGVEYVEPGSASIARNDIDGLRYTTDQSGGMVLAISEYIAYVGGVMVEPQTMEQGEYVAHVIEVPPLEEVIIIPKEGNVLLALQLYGARDIISWGNIEYVTSTAPTPDGDVEMAISPCRSFQSSMLRSLPKTPPNTTDLSYFFAGMTEGCEPRAVIDAMLWDTSNVTRMSGLFYGSLVVPIALLWDTSNVTDFSYMLKSAGIHHSTSVFQWDTSSGINFDGFAENLSSGAEVSFEHLCVSSEASVVDAWNNVGTNVTPFTVGVCPTIKPFPVDYSPSVSWELYAAPDTWDGQLDYLLSCGTTVDVTDNITQLSYVSDLTQYRYDSRSVRLRLTASNDVLEYIGDGTQLTQPALVVSDGENNAILVDAVTYDSLQQNPQTLMESTTIENLNGYVLGPDYTVMGTGGIVVIGGYIDLTLHRNYSTDVSTVFGFNLTSEIDREVKVSVCMVPKGTHHLDLTNGMADQYISEITINLSDGISDSWTLMADAYGNKVSGTWDGAGAVEFKIDRPSNDHDIYLTYTLTVTPQDGDDLTLDPGIYPVGPNVSLRTWKVDGKDTNIVYSIRCGEEWEE